MCCLISDPKKLQPAPGFPKGWLYVIKEPPKGSGNTVLDGLYLYAPSGRKRPYRSVRGATARGCHARVLRENPRVSEIFHHHMGVPDPGLPSAMYAHRAERDEAAVIHVSHSFPANKRKRTDTAISPRVAKKAGNGTVLTPRELYQRRCNQCTLCRKADCGRCATCIRNRSREGEGGREVCLRKVNAVAVSFAWPLLFFWNISVTIRMFRSLYGTDVLLNQGGEQSPRSSWLPFWMAIRVRYP